MLEMLTKVAAYMNADNIVEIFGVLSALAFWGTQIKIWFASRHKSKLHGGEFVELTGVEKIRQEREKDVLGDFRSIHGFRNDLKYVWGKWTIEWFIFIPMPVRFLEMNCSSILPKEDGLKEKIVEKIGETNVNK